MSRIGDFLDRLFPWSVFVFLALFVSGVFIEAFRHRTPVAAPVVPAPALPDAPLADPDIFRFVAPPAADPHAPLHVAPPRTPILSPDRDGDAPDRTHA